MLSEVKAVTLGVSHLQRACAFYEQALQYRVQSQGEIAPELASLWRFDPALRGQYAVVAADDSGLGKLRLVAFDAPGERLWNTDNLYIV